MTAFGIQLLTVFRMLVELAGAFLLAQGALFLVLGSARERNVVYQLFQVVTRPVFSATRFLLPAASLNKHIPWLSFLFLFVLWILLAYLRLSLCPPTGTVCG